MEEELETREAELNRLLDHKRALKVCISADDSFLSMKFSIKSCHSSKFRMFDSLTMHYCKTSIFVGFNDIHIECIKILELCNLFLSSHMPYIMD